MTDDLLQAVRDLPRVSRYLHVPAQSGCDEVLKRMKRMYTVALYDDMLARIRETIPDVAVSSDFIVGFCGETEASFERTVRLVERSRFKNSFIFKYSPRQGTKADTLFIDDVPEEVKKRRNNDLLAIQTAISLEDNRRFLGRTVEVLVEGPSKSAARHDEVGGVQAVDRPDGLRPDRGLRGPRAADRADACRSRWRMPARSPCSVDVVTNGTGRDAGVRGETDGESRSTTWWVVGSRRSGSIPPSRRRPTPSMPGSAGAPIPAARGPTRA